jgi:cobalt-zinc-cadmium resistance protein CzcA
MALIGGVLALEIMGMPFSIYAGVGFMALSGISILNGVVLISYLNRLISVVVGGIISATILTLIVLPSMYRLFFTRMNFVKKEL